MSLQLFIRPLGLWEIALHSFRIYLQKLPILLALWVLLFGPLLAIIWGTNLLSLESNVISIIVFVLATLVFQAAILYFYAATTLVVSLHMKGFKASFIQIVGRLRGAIAIQLLGTAFFQSIAIFGGMLLLLFPAVMFFVRFMFAMPVVVLERKVYTAAMRRSRELVGDNWWRLFGAILLFTLFIIIVYIIIVLFYLILSALIAESGSIWLNGLLLVVFIGLLFAVSPIGFVYPVLLYYDLRVRKEAANSEIIFENI